MSKNEEMKFQNGETSKSSRNCDIKHQHDPPQSTSYQNYNAAKSQATRPFPIPSHIQHLQQYDPNASLYYQYYGALPTNPQNQSGSSYPSSASLSLPLPLSVGHVSYGAYPPSTGQQQQSQSCWQKVSSGMPSNFQQQQTNYSSPLHPPITQDQPITNIPIPTSAANSQMKCLPAQFLANPSNQILSDDCREDSKSNKILTPTNHDNDAPSTSSGQINQQSNGGTLQSRLPSSLPNQLPSSSHVNPESEVVERLASFPDRYASPDLLSQRRAFFKRLVDLTEQDGEVLNSAPQVSKSAIDLFRLYHAVMKRGGFEKVIKDKLWKHLCVEANPEMQESSAAGYQLRKHYQKYLLKMECLETGANPQKLVEFADSQKKKKKEKESTLSGSSSVGQQGQDRTTGTTSLGVPTSVATSLPHVQGQFTSVLPHHSGYPIHPPYHYGGMHPQAHNSSVWPPNPTQGPGYMGYHSANIPHMASQYYLTYNNIPRFAQLPNTDEHRLQQQMQHQQSTISSHQRAMDAQPSSSRTSNSATPVQQMATRSDSRASTGPTIPSTSTPEASDERFTNTIQAQPVSSGTFSTADAPTPPLIAQSSHHTQHATIPIPPVVVSTASRPSSRAGTNEIKQPQYNNYPTHQSQAELPIVSIPSSSVTYLPQATWGNYGANQRSIPISAVTLQSETPSSTDINLKQHNELFRRQHMMQNYAGQPSFPATSKQFSPTNDSKFQKNQPAPILAQSYRSQIAHTNLTNQILPNQGILSVIPPLPMNSFPPGSLESTATSFYLKRTSEKIYAKDIVMMAPRRLAMALRSGLYLDTIWAINVLNVLLYDDLTGTPSAMLINQIPDILGLLVDHLFALLSLLFQNHFTARNCRKCQRKILHSNKVSKKNSAPISFAGMVTKIRPLVKSTLERSQSRLNFTLLTRTGREIQFETVEENEIPPYVRSESSLADKSTIELNSKRSPYSTNISENDFDEFIQRLRESTASYIRSKNHMTKPVFNQPNGKEYPKTCSFLDSFDKVCLDESPKLVDRIENYPMFFRMPYIWEKWDSTKISNTLPLKRNTTIQDHSDEVVELAHLSTAVSNIIRGFSFIHGNEKPFSQCTDLLRLLSLVLQLNTMDKTDKEFIGETTDTDKGLEFFVSRDEASLIPHVEEDSDSNFLLDLANRLRDDAFVILSNICPYLDLFETENDTAYKLLDALLYWAISTEIQARDPLASGIISPRDYCLEIFCKMSVVERNMDMLLSTGPWPRLEELIRLLCKLVIEKPPTGEFAIIILNAICALSEPSCYLAAACTPLIEYLITFLEAADINMHQFVQQHGMNALRENPEKIGTSVGMLRRATLIMLHIVRHEHCREFFVRYQNRLLQFTVSHFMDSRVAAMVADILFEVQRVDGDSDNSDDLENEEIQRAISPCSSSTPIRDDLTSFSPNNDIMVDRVKSYFDDRDIDITGRSPLAADEGNTGTGVWDDDNDQTLFEKKEDNVEDDESIDDTMDSRCSQDEKFVIKRKSSDEENAIEFQRNNHAFNVIGKNESPSSSCSSATDHPQSGHERETSPAPRKKTKRSEDINERIRNSILKRSSLQPNQNIRNGLVSPMNEKVNGLSPINTSSLFALNALEEDRPNRTTRNIEGRESGVLPSTDCATANFQTPIP